jgi:hypothetical protein
LTNVEKFPEPLERAIIMPGWSEGPEFIGPFIEAINNSGLHDPAKTEVVYLGDALANPYLYRSLIGIGTIYGHSAFMRGGARIVQEAIDGSKPLPQQVIAFDAFETTGPLRLAFRAMKVAKKYGDQRQDGVPEAGMFWAPREIMRHPVENILMPLTSRRFSTSQNIAGMVQAGMFTRGVAMFFNEDSEFSFGSQEVVDQVNNLGGYALAAWQEGRHNRVMFEPKKSLNEAASALGWTS